MITLPELEEIKPNPNDIRIYTLLFNNKGRGYTAGSLRLATGLSQKAVRYSIEKLIEKNIISKEPNLNDLRGFLYFIET